MMRLILYYSREVLADMVASGRVGAWAAWAAVDGAWAYWVAWAAGDRVSEAEGRRRAAACLACPMVTGRVRPVRLTVAGRAVESRAWHCGEPFAPDAGAGTCGRLVVVGGEPAGAAVVASKACPRWAAASASAAAPA